MTKESIRELELLLREVLVHLSEPSPMNRRAAVKKLERVSSLAATLAATIQAQR